MSDTGNIRVVNFTPENDEAQADIIALLERWLERAKAGELSAVAIAGATRYGSQTTEFNNGVRSSLVLNSAVTTLFWRYNNLMNQP